MILIGQYDSPFVRRVGIALRLYGLPFEHRPWSTFGDADKVRAYNPLTRVPTLVLDDGDVLIDSHLILDHLDNLVPKGQALFPMLEPARRRALKVAGLATGAADKAVSLFYEMRLHDTASDSFMERCRAQIAGGLGELEADRAARDSAWWSGERFGHADIAVAVVWRFISDVHPALAEASRYPALSAHSIRMEALPVFQEIRQAFIPPT
jgi:glutathione S-transferase